MTIKYEYIIDFGDNNTDIADSFIELRDRIVRNIINPVPLDELKEKDRKVLVKIMDFQLVEDENDRGDDNRVNEQLHKFSKLVNHFWYNIKIYRDYKFMVSVDSVYLYKEFANLIDLVNSKNVNKKVITATLKDLQLYCDMGE